MRAGRASRTAEHNALFRALEAARPARRRLVDDHLARRFLTGPLALVSRLAGLPGAADAIAWVIDRRWPGVRTSVVARTRLIDDAVTSIVGEGVGQIVVLGAGFDTRAYRLAALRGLPTFEVDHPDTQRAKRKALAAALDDPPDDVRFVACDFQTGALAAAMEGAGFQATVPTLFVWEGTTNYLTAPAVEETLRWCGRAAARSRLVFTYVHQDVLTDPSRFVGTERLFATLADVDERFTYGIDPAALGDLLAGCGLVLESDIGAADFRLRCYGEAARTMRGHEFYRVARAEVAGG
jgi:methyltransferase (TIGR00027 family)